MSAPAILVLVPSYNHGAFIGDRVSSILKQTNRDFEVHVVDDGSTDATMDVLAGFSDPRLIVRRRETNSGSPCTTWLEARELLKKRPFDFVWIAESDDRAEPHFLDRGVRKLREQPDASLYYCHSWFIDDADLIIGHSISYLKRVFPDIDWNRGWFSTGSDFIRDGLIRGMAIPNMSSALIRADAFVAALRTSFVRYKLAADWIFAIEVARRGGVIFDPWDGNYFRHHQRTSRTETDLPRMLFEHMSATRTAYLSGAVDRALYAKQMRVWTGMYRHERVSIAKFVKHGWKISRSDLFKSLPELAKI